MSGEESTIRWRDDWVAFLIKCRQKHNHLFTGKKFTANNGWAIIKREMVNAGLPREVSLSQVRKKWCNLTTKYKDFKHRFDNQEADFNPYHWQFYDTMENVLSTQTKQQIIKSSRTLKDTEFKTKVEPKKPISIPKTSTVTTRSMNVPQEDGKPVMYNLTWNNFHSNLSSGFHSLLEDGEMVDVTLACQGKLVLAHKLVLSVCSPLFKKMFQSNPCKHPVVFLKDIGHEIMHGLLEFMYTGQVNVNENSLKTFLETAEALQIKGLIGQRKNLNNKIPIRQENNEENDEKSVDGNDEDELEVTQPSTSKPVNMSYRKVEITPASKQNSHDPLDTNEDDGYLQSSIYDNSVKDESVKNTTVAVLPVMPTSGLKRRKRMKVDSHGGERTFGMQYIKEEPSVVLTEEDYESLNSLNTFIGITDTRSSNTNRGLVKYDTPVDLG